MAYEHDEEFRSGILQIFAEGQTLPVAKGRATSRGLLDFKERNGFKTRPALGPLRQYRCPECGSSSEKHRCPVDATPPVFSVRPSLGWITHSKTHQYAMAKQRRQRARLGLPTVEACPWCGSRAVAHACPGYPAASARHGDAKETG